MSTPLKTASQEEDHGTSRSRSPLLRFLAQVGLAVWVPTVALGIGSLMVSHWAPLPEPEVNADSRLSLALEDLLQAEQGSRHPWSLVHVLYESCGCSQRVAQHLVESERPENVSEWLLLVRDEDNEADTALEEAAILRGFHVARISPQELDARYGVTAAPLFVVLDLGGTIRFCGGYTDRKQGLHYLDRDTLRQLRAGATPPSIPVYGCGVSRSLQAALDPFLLKY